MDRQTVISSSGLGVSTRIPQKPTFDLEQSTWLHFLQKTFDGRFTQVKHADACDLKMMILLGQ
jgi:hypothetical protein